MDECDAAEIITNVFSVVSYCHSINIILMDLKPENILFHSEKGYSLKLVDFHFA